MDTSNCIIYCYQCDLEIIDFELKMKNEEKINLFHIRKLFFNQIKISDNDLKKSEKNSENKLILKDESNLETLSNNLKIKKLNFKYFEEFQMPLNYLESFLQIVYSNNYLRKSLKKIFLSNLYVKQNYCFDLNPKLINQLSEIIYFFDKKDQKKNIIQKFFFQIIKNKPQLGKYTYNNYNVK